MRVCKSSVYYYSLGHVMYTIHTHIITPLVCVIIHHASFSSIEITKIEYSHSFDGDWLSCPLLARFLRRQWAHGSVVVVVHDALQVWNSYSRKINGTMYLFSWSYQMSAIPVRSVYPLEQLNTSPVTQDVPERRDSMRTRPLPFPCYLTKSHLDRSRMVPSAQQLPVRSNLRAVGHVIEPTHAAYLLPSCSSVQRDVCRARHGEIVRRRFAEMYARHWCIVCLRAVIDGS